MPWFWAAVAALLASGCAPELNWREVRLEAAGVALMMPCRPAEHERMQVLAGESVAWRLSSCRTGEAIWSIGYARFGSESIAQAAARELIGTAEPRDRAWPPAGGRASQRGQRVARELRAPEGRVVQSDAVVIAAGPLLVRVMVHGVQLDAESAEFFLGSMSWRE